MKPAKIIVASILILALVLPAAALLVPEEAQAQPAASAWPMFRQNSQHTGRSLYNGPEVPVLKWSYTTGGDVKSSPAIGADGTIYVGSCDDNLHAINADGSLQWSYTTGYYVKSSPAIGADGTIYVGSWDDDLYAINADGSLKWSYDT